MDLLLLRDFSDMLLLGVGSEILLVSACWFALHK